MSGETQTKTITVSVARYQLVFDSIKVTDGTGVAIEPGSLHRDHGIFLSMEVSIPSLSPVIVQLNRIN